MMSCGGGSFTPDGTYDSMDDWKIHHRLFPVPRVRGCVCMLNDWISSNDEICAVNHIYSRFKLKGKCRSEKWEVYLYGDMTIKVERAQVQFLDSGDMPVVVTTGLGVQTCRKLWFSTVAVFDKVADVPARAVHRQGVDVPDGGHPSCAETVGFQQGVHAMKGSRSSSHR